MIALGVDLGDHAVRALRVNEQGKVIGRWARSADRAAMASTLLECSRRLRPSRAGRITVVLSTLGADAAAIGAARGALLQRQ